MDLNLGPIPYKGIALAAELQGQLAERVGFEPTEPFYRSYGFQDRRLKPDSATSPDWFRLLDSNQATKIQNLGPYH